MPIVFLLLDDNPDDRMLTRRELERHFSECEVREVADREGFEKEIQAGLAVDVVVTDFQMRWTTGLEILERVKTYDPKLPVIMFTATGTQEVAVEAMKLGLDDYLIKSPRHYARLPVAVRTCLDRTEIRARAIRSETRLSSLLEHIHLGVFRMSLEGKLEECNTAFWDMFKGEKQELASFEHPLLARVRQCLPELKMALDTKELRFQDKNLDQGGKFFVVRLLRVKVNGHDAVDGIVEDATSLHQADIKIQKMNEELEDRIIERTRQLEEANDALEAFGFSVSHDLREPLRTIQGYAEALRQDYYERNFKQLDTYVDRISAIARRIDMMVSDLLEFARLSRTEISLEIVPVDAAIQEAQAALMSDPGYKQAIVGVDVPAELQAKAHRMILVQALTNLLSNAVKFVAHGSRPEIHIGARLENKAVRIEVKDHGLGISDEAQSRIFNVFERLHGMEEYPGTGIGLAIVKKGIERMGGRVGVHSSPGAGSTFWIELPSA